MYEDLISKKKKLAVLGLGYVGLPIALEFAKKISVIGFDISNERIGKMKNNIDPSGELESSAFENCDIEFTTDPEKLREAHFYIVTVPTPIDDHNPRFKANSWSNKIYRQGFKERRLCCLRIHRISWLHGRRLHSDS
jgi:UDP-N-acetyl-D-glucosamine/UDP-N-acetyl-D-galactosamine dehydrogenase